MLFFTYKRPLLSHQGSNNSIGQQGGIMVLLPKKHTDNTGDLSEVIITARLIEVGYSVLTPYGKNHRYDLVIEDADAQFWRVQCKTGWTDENKGVYLLPVNDVGMTQANLRLIPSGNNQEKGVRWAKDYEL